MTASDSTAVRLSGRTGLLAAIPALLGFHPRESLVLACLSGPRGQLGPVVRVDVDTGAGRASSPLVEQLRAHARQYADRVALVCYTDHPGAPRLLLDVLTALTCDGAAIADVVVVGGDEARPDPEDAQTQAMAAATVLHGRAVLPDREALQRSIAGPTGQLAGRATAALHAAADTVLSIVGTAGPVDASTLDDVTGSYIDKALREVTVTGSVPLFTSAVLVLLCCHVGIRDRLIARAVGELDDRWVPMLIAVARNIPDAEAAQICVALSMAAYRRGDGALAQVAVDRCLRGDPGHRLAELMLGAMATGLPPQELVQLTRAEPISPGTDG